MTDVKLISVSKSFGDTSIIDGFSHEIPSGSFTVIVGPSGCGKSTLLRLIAGLENPDSGQIWIGDRDVTATDPAERRIAMVFQSYALYPHMSVAQNIGFRLKVSGVRREDIKRQVAAAAELLRLTPYLDRKPRDLSGGQRQRVAIGRAIVSQPDVFLFDEPLSNLDAALRGQMRVELSALHRRLSSTMVYVTHDQTEAMTMADQIVVMNGGRIEQVGAPLELYAFPETTFVAGFIGQSKMNLLEGPAAREFDCECLGIRPEHIDMVEEGGRWAGAVCHVERLGAETILHVDIANLGQIVVKTTGDRPLTVGDTLQISPDERRLHRFSSGRRLP